MAIALPYPYPQLDVPDNPWDSFALLRNLQFLANRIDTVGGAGEQSSALLRFTSNPYATVTGGTSEVSIFPTAQSIAGGVLGTTRTLRMTAIGDVLNNTGGSSGFTLRAKYGGTTILTITSLLFTSSGTRKGWDAYGYLAAAGASNRQYSRGSIQASFNIPGVSGAVSDDGNGTVYSSSHSSITVDSSTTQSYDVTIQPANSAVSVRVFGLLVERI